jgi:hypothetical protein
LTLLKQARAFGLGITLATQNPVDLDYKGLSNIGTWFLGRLQTERDKARVLEGLEGAAGQAGQEFDRGKMEQVLAGLGNRVFLMNNVHDGFPTVFQTRWAMSFLAGPLARGQISRLMEQRKSAAATQSSSPPASQSDSANQSDSASQSDTAAGAVPTPPAMQAPERPIVPAGIEERFVAANQRPAQGAKLFYRPALYGQGSMHFIRKTADLDIWRDAKRLVMCQKGFPEDVWQSSQPLPEDADLMDEPDQDFHFLPLPDELLGKGKYRSYKSQLKDYLYRHHSANIYKCPLVKGYAPPGDEGEAKAFFQHRIREARDEEIEKLRDKHEAKLNSLAKKMQTAEARVDREKAQSRTSMISAGSSLVGALLGGFLGGRRTRVSTVARGVGYASQQGSDVRRAEEALDLLKDDVQKLEDDLRDDLDQLNKEYDSDRIELEVTEVPPRKSDLQVEDPLVLWLPFQVGQLGIESPLY